MATPFQVLDTIGTDLSRVVTAVAIAAGTEAPVIAVGTVVIGNDGKLWVYGKANATITASTTVCTVNATTFLVTATGGAYTSPAVGLVTGDYAWFNKALV